MNDFADIAKAREVIAEKFPAVFMRKGAPKKIPLKIGIVHDVIASMPEMSPELIKRAVGDYCSGPKYARAMIAGVQRIDLRGKPAGEVTAEAEKHARWREKNRRDRSRQHFQQNEATKVQEEQP